MPGRNTTRTGTARMGILRSLAPVAPGLLYAGPGRAVTLQPGDVVVAAVRCVLIAVMALAARPAVAAPLAPGDVVLVQAYDTFGVYGGQIVRLDPATLAPTTISPSGGLVRYAKAVVVDRTGDILVADLTAGIVRVDATTGAQSVLATITALGGSPTGICLAPAGGFYVSVDGSPAAVVHLASDGATVIPVSTGGMLAYPGGLAVGPDGALYVAEGALPPDNGGGTLQNRGSIVRVEAGSGAQTLIAADSLFNGPFAIAFAAPDEIWTAQAGSVAGRYGCFVRTRLSTGRSFLVSSSPCRSHGLAAMPGRPIYVSDCNTLGPDCSQLYTERYPGGPILVHYGGPLAIAPDGIVPVRQGTWGMLKTIYR